MMKRGSVGDDGFCVLWHVERWFVKCKMGFLGAIQGLEAQLLFDHYGLEEILMFGVLSTTTTPYLRSPMTRQRVLEPAIFRQMWSL